METEKKILYVSHTLSIHTGSPRALIDLIANLDKRKFKPCLLVPHRGELSEILEKDGTEIYTMGSVSLSKFNFVKFILNTLSYLLFYRRHKIDIIHYNGIGWRDSFVVAARLLKIPVILHLHNPYPKNEIRGNFNLNLADHIVIVSDSMKSAFEEEEGIYKKLIRIHNGVDLKRFKSEGLEPKLRAGKDGSIIGFVGQISKRKGLEYLIKASPEILKQFPSTQFWVVGQDGIGEEGLSIEMKRLSNQLGFEKNFVFFGKQDDIPHFMNRFDLLIVPSVSEPFGKVIIEAMACQKCVIASNVGGIPEIIKDGENGLLVPPRDSKSLGQAILNIMENAELRMKLAESGYHTAINHFSIKRVAERTEKLYSELISRKRRD